MAQDPSWANPNTTRSQVVLEIAAEMVTAPAFRTQSRVQLRDPKTGEWSINLWSASTTDALDAVLRREAALAMINPAGPLTLAYRGAPPYDGPQPVRTIAVIPSLDQYVFAVRPETNLSSFEEIGERRVPLKLWLRGTPDHYLHPMLDHIMEASGFSMAALESWGGAARREGMLPDPESAKFKALLSGAVDAIFDEAADVWVDEAAEAGMTILPLREATMRRLEAMGYRRAVLEKRVFPHLPHDILTIDFSGWPIFVHAELPDALVTQICAGLDARKDKILWQGHGPLPVERMCRDAPDTPLDVPLHPAAERYWRGRGYIR